MPRSQDLCTQIILSLVHSEVSWCALCHSPLCTEAIQLLSSTISVCVGRVAKHFFHCQTIASLAFRLHLHLGGERHHVNVNTPFISADFACAAAAAVASIASTAGSAVRSLLYSLLLLSLLLPSKLLWLHSTAATLSHKLQIWPLCYCTLPNMVCSHLSATLFCPFCCLLLQPPL